MGQQQVVLIVIGILLVTIAITAGTMAFTEDAMTANRQAMIGDLERLGAHAQGYYRWPAALGGGAGSFSGLKLGRQNHYGTYTIASVTADCVVLLGSGRETGTDGAPLRMQMTVLPDTMMVAIAN
jgi:hypothetical protein